VRRHRIAATILTVILVITVFYLTFSATSREGVNEVEGNVLVVGQRLPSFTLENTAGEKVGLENFKGRIVLIFFGYTNCPDICPLAIKRFAELRALLGSKSSQVIMLMVTVDPNRDTPDVLDKFVKKFNTEIIALTGSWNELTEVWAKYHARPLERDENALFVTHSALIYVSDRDLKLRKIFTPEMSAEMMLKGLENVL